MELFFSLKNTNISRGLLGLKYAGGRKREWGKFKHPLELVTMLTSAKKLKKKQKQVLKELNFF